MTPDLPVMRDMDHCAYYKEDAGKLLGAFEPKAKPWASDGIPADFRIRRIAGRFRSFRTDFGRRDEARSGAWQNRHPQILQWP